MKPRIGLVFGDPCGIGPELIAKLLAHDDVRQRADILVVGDAWLFHQGEQCAGVSVDVQMADTLEQVEFVPGQPVFLRLYTVSPQEVRVSEALPAGGRSVLTALKHVLGLARQGVIDAIMFAPLNKQAMHLAGYGFEDELRWFAHELDYTGTCSEFNILEALWTSRVTSHVALSEVPKLITGERIVETVRLIDHTLRSSGRTRPHIAVAALNPHAGDGGIFGREEIDIIEPAVRLAREYDIQVDGPFPSDTIFLKARDGAYDAIVTMYHDQGQIAMKLMGFERGVTVQGGLPIPICTPAHGTAFDIAGQGKANVEATRRAFFLACTMGESRQAETAP
jgi:4-hydroxythreonine-4-phosphate dehydrogenase